MMAGQAGPDKFIVRILDADGNAGGLGILVGERHVVTCAHVVNAVLRREHRAQSQPESAAWVLLDFPLLDDRRRLRASVVAWLPPSDSRGIGDDIAGLIIDEAPPAGATA